MALFREHEHEQDHTYRVAELGCGAHAPFHSLFHGRDGFQVHKFDLQRWDSDTTVTDLNHPDWQAPDTDIAVFSGVLEYLDDLRRVLHRSMARSRYLLISYAFVPAARCVDDASYLAEINLRAVRHGWRNHHSAGDMVRIISDVGVISAVGQWRRDQSLFLVRNHSV